MTDHEVIELYHAHGECEQSHSEIKTDINLEQLPSGKFEANAWEASGNSTPIVGNPYFRYCDLNLYKTHCFSLFPPCFFIFSQYFLIGISNI